MDQRRFDHAMKQATSTGESRKLSIIVGGVVAICGLLVAGYLTTHNGQIVGGIIATFLATIIAVILGSQLS